MFIKKASFWVQLSITAYDHLNLNFSPSSSYFFLQMVSMFSSIIIYTTIPIYVYNVLGNLMVIVIIQKNKRLRECPNTFLLQALSSADLCFSVEVFISVVLLSKDASNATADFTFDALSSIYILATLSMERYYAILKPFVHMRKVTKTFVRKFVCAIFVVAAVLSAPGYYITFERSSSVAKERANRITRASRSTAWLETLNTTYSIVLFIFGFILPTASMVFSYSRVIYYAWSKAEPNVNVALLKARKKLTSLFILVTVVFFVTWSPTFVRMIVTGYAHDQKTLKFELLSMLIALFGSAANPLIYTMRCPRFRQEVVKLFNCSRCKRTLPPQLH